ncbi:MAG: DUF4998 domain-containing protein [Prevotellaceae bacterium]|nr:DUF4998 domain-containing protein [Prevotellaceae bacterium]
MRYFIKSIIPLWLLFWIGCDDNNSLHQQYLDRGETIYIGAVDSIVASPGYKRVKFDWRTSTDPRIEKTVFHWSQNNESFTFEIPVGKAEIGREKSYIHDFDEGVYSFEVVNEDNREGNRSLSKEITVEVYGDSYIESLRNINILSMTVSDDNTELTVNWAGIESALTQYTTVSYLSRTGSNPDPQRVENTDTKTVIVVGQILPGDSLSVVTSYLPEDGIDIVDAIPKKYAVK